MLINLLMTILLLMMLVMLLITLLVLLLITNVDKGLNPARREIFEAEVNHFVLIEMFAKTFTHMLWALVIM